MIDEVQILIFSSLTIIYAVWIIILLIPKKNKIVRESYPKISIILPTYNEGNVIEDSIKSLLDAEYPNDREIIVANDGSTDNTRAVVENLMKKFTEIKLLNLQHGGKSNALNTAIKSSLYDILVILDADSLVEKNSLKEIVKPLNETDVGGVTGIIRARINKNPLTWFQDFEYILSSGWRYICTKIDANSILPGFAAFKKEALLKINGFSTETLTEDFDIVLALREVGYKTKTIPSAMIFTTVPQTIGNLLRQRLRWARGTIQVIRKYKKFIISKDSGFMGLFTIPSQFYWYVHATIYLPTMLYMMISGYYKYFLVKNDILSLAVFKYFFSWMSFYGMIEMVYRVITGYYALTFIMLLTIIASLLSILYTLLVIFKLSRPKIHDFIVYFFFFPYSLFNLSILSASLIYELTKPKTFNIWEK